MTDFPEDLFTQVYRRAPTGEDQTRLLAVKAALGLSSRDEFWGVIMALDHYEQSIRAGRTASVKEVKALLAAVEEIPEKAGPIAAAEAQKAIARLIEDASNKIARASAQKSITTADRISRRQWVVAMIAGGIAGLLMAAAGATAMYLVLDARGICVEPPFRTQNGIAGCFVERES